MKRLTNRFASLAFVLPLQIAPSPADASDPLASLKNDPDLASWNWTEVHAPAYSPFSLLAGRDGKANGCTTQEVEEQYAAALTALVDLWRVEWVLPLDLSPSVPGSRAMLAFLPSFSIHKEIAVRKFPNEETVPGSYLRGEVAVTYLFGNAFESRGARQSAVLTRAGERLLALYQPAGKPFPAWLHAGLASYFGELRAKGEGRDGAFFTREESASWRTALASAAEELRVAQTPIPEFEDLLRAGSLTDLQTKSHGLREFVRLSGYSLALFWRTRQGERYTKPFQSYLKAEFRGEGGPERFRAEMQQHAGTFLKDWREFCAPGGGTLSPTKEEPKAPVPAPKKNAPTAASLSPVTLDMTPRTLIDLRAEVLRKARAGRFDEALHEVFDVREKQSDVLKPHLAAEKRMIETATLLYEAFAKSNKPGDRLSAAFGHAGEIVRIHPDGSFEVREKSGIKRYPWTALSLPAIAAHAYKELRRNGPEETLDYATALLLCGQLEAAKDALGAANLAGASAQRSDWLRKMIPDFELAIPEAKARDAIEEIAGLELPRAVEKLRRRMLESEFRASAAREIARPFLEGMLGVHFGRVFEEQGIASLFRGKTQIEDGRVSLRYSFDDEGELADWERAEIPPVAEWFGVKASSVASWSCREGKLRIASSGARTHAATWSGEISLRVVFESALGVSKDSNPPTRALCAGLGTSRDRWIGNAGLRNLLRFAPGIASSELGQKTKESLVWESTGIHELRLQRSGSSITASCDGNALGTLDAAEPSLGPVFLFAAGEAEIWIHEITIQGKLDAQSDWYRAKKTKWIQREIVGVLGN